MGLRARHRRQGTLERFASREYVRWQVVKLELPVAIDIVALKSSVRIELVDTDQHSAIVATSPVDDRHATSKSRIELLATSLSLSLSLSLSPASRIPND